MKRLTTAAFTVLSVLACTPARSQPSADFSSIDARLKACSDLHPDIPGSANCTKMAADAADKRLNELYSNFVQGRQPLGPERMLVPRRSIQEDSAFGGCSSRVSSLDRHCPDRDNMGSEIMVKPAIPMAM